MLPIHTRVVAIDDVEDHLQKIVWGLGKAGFCPIPYLFEDGRLENPPEHPLPGVRLVFSDIHMVTGGAANHKIHASNIIKCLKQIVDKGPYALIFWSQYPEEAETMSQHILERAHAAGIVAPIGFASIDKNAVFNIPANADGDDFNAQQLRTLILERLKDFKTLAIAASWDDRVAKAAARTTNALFGLVESSECPTETWDQLLAYLACEAVGRHRAEPDLRSALDTALFPLLEDQLTLIGSEPAGANQDISHILEIIQAKRPKRPKPVPVARLNSKYLIDPLRSVDLCQMWDRGMVTELGGAFVNSGEFVRAFGLGDDDLIQKEFVCKKTSVEERRKMKLHIVELGPECDHVQGKIAAHRYLLAVLLPTSLLEKCQNDSSYRNASILDTGELSLSGYEENQHLLISCRCFMTLAPNVKVDGKCKFRLRRGLLEEVAHHYTNHARRPGVMRFKS